MVNVMDWKLSPGSWWIADPGTAKPEHEVGDGRFVDEWPDGWRCVVEAPGPKARMEFQRGRSWIWLSSPIPGLQVNEVVMLGWQAEAGNERIVAEIAAMIDETKIELARNQWGLHVCGPQ